VDVVANLQVIEHLWDQEGFLAECRRVLRPDGRLLITTPNRLTFSPGRDAPLNPFHTRELAPSELDSLLRAAGFEVELLAGLRHGPGIDGSIIEEQVRVAVSGSRWPDSLLAKVSAVTADDFVVGTEDLDGSLDLVAVARR
jgi:SAM-dependent methyltransferase